MRTVFAIRVQRSQTLIELSGLAYPRSPSPLRPVFGLGDIGAWLFEHLRVVRVYTKLPGHAADLQRPFTIRAGQTVRDVAGSCTRISNGRCVTRASGAIRFRRTARRAEHTLFDRDVVELHA
jgi:ribosome-interacting GTPase 1